MADEKVHEPYPGMDPALQDKMDSCVQDVMDKQGMSKDAAIPICRASLEEETPVSEVLYFHWNGLLAEAATKKEDGKDFPAGDFAYVPDPESPSTWKLRLTATPGGGPDSGIVGAAIAALGKGFRGNKVAIPAGDLPAVKAKVRAAWTKANPDKAPEDMPPAIKEDAPVEEAATIKSRVRAAIKALDELLEDKDIPESVRANVKNMRETFRKTWADLGSEASGSRQAENAPQEGTNITEHFAESYGGVVLSEADQTLDPARAPLTMQVRLIRPGWGNAKDNHYYTPEVIKSAEPLFMGKKMYTTDHNQAEKNVMTEVAKIDKIASYDADGAPIADVKVINPAFAEMVRTRQAAGELGTLECSVLGNGTAKPFELDGRKGKLVESITDIESVDWVTRAGAGGKALNVAESEPKPSKTEGVNMTDQDKKIEVTTPPATVTVTPVIEAAKPAPAEPTRLSEAAVTALLEAEKRLPVSSRERLAKGQYETEDAVKAAISDKLAELADAVGSGKPFGLGAAPTTPKKTFEEMQKDALAALDKVNEKYGMKI